MGDESTVPSRRTCWRLSILTFAAVIPVACGPLFERPPS
jgi:hypothetical protein